ncbi:hypothetical protein G9A89_020918 [Geosiphon pyriformis]|nr:hypothetical protein G9A89_020918 [Geosiphon pyriformis]
MLRKELKFKTNLPKNFPNEALYHPELYVLKTFEQVLAENILAGLVVFANAGGILNKLFKHRVMELVLINLLIDPTNCFLAGAIYVLKLCNLSLGGDLPDSLICVWQGLLGGVCFKWNTFHRWKKLDSRGPVPVWFVLLVEFIKGSGLSNHVALSYCSALTDFSCNFGYINECLLNSDLSFVIVYTDGSVKGLGLLGAHSGAIAYFLNVNVSIRVKMDGLLSSTLMELQVIALALECVPTSRSVNLFINSQTLLNLCESGGGVFSPDFHDKCWIKKEHICHNKVKDYSGIVGNEHANFYTDATVASKFFLSLVVPYHFLRIENRPVSRNARHVAKKLFNTVHSVGWEAKCVGNFINVGLCDCFDKAKTFCVWHPDGKIKSGYTSSALMTLWSYLMKVLYHHLLVAKRKRLYNLRYLSIACIQCELVEDSDHMFSCVHNANVRETLLFDAFMEWNMVLGIFANENAIANLLLEAGFFIDLFTVLIKGFVLKDWVADTVSCLGAGFGGGILVVNFIHHFAKSHKSAIWILVAKLRSYYKKHNLLLQDGFSFSLVSGLSSLWSAESIRDFGFRLGIHMCFGLHLCLTKLDFGFLSGFLVAGIMDV